MMIALNKIRNVANAQYLHLLNGNDELSEFEDELRFSLNWGLKKVKGTPSDDALKMFLLWVYLFGSLSKYFQLWKFSFRTFAMEKSRDLREGFLVQNKMAYGDESSRDPTKNRLDFAEVYCAVKELAKFPDFK